MAIRAVADRPDVTAIQQVASRLWPLGWHPGGLGWSLARGRLAEHVVVFDDGDAGVVGWAGAGGHDAGEIFVQVEPDRDEVAAALVDWALDATGAAELTVEVSDGERTAAAALRAAGFAQAEGGEDVFGMTRLVLTRDELPPLAEGYTVRPVEAGETAARVEVHRAAWRPATLPHADEHAPPVDPQATSPFDAAAYQSVRATWLYDPQLDLAAVTAGGEMAGCCIAWYDPDTGCAEIEPLGVVPEHRRRGLAVAMCLEVAARVGELGGTEVFINVGPREDYPAPSGAYAKAGYVAARRGGTWTLKRG